MKAILSALAIIVLGSTQELSTRTFTTPLNDQAVKDEDQWKSIEEEFKYEHYGAIFIDGSIVSPLGFQKFLNLELELVSTLSIKNVVLTKEMLQLLFNHPLFQALQVLQLAYCNIHDEDLQRLKPINSNLIILSFEGNYLTQKGIKKLAQIKPSSIVGLLSLSLSGNSLQSDEAVSSILQNWNLKNLQVLDISSTSISEKNALKFLNKMKPRAMNRKFSPISELFFGQNDFSPHFFKKISKYHFDDLEFLSFSDLLIDEESIEYLSSWKLPSLAQLDINGNSLKTEPAKKWINKKNMPNLQALQINFNFVGEEFIDHLANEGFELVGLLLKVFHMEPTALSSFSKLSFQYMEVFSYSFATVTPTEFRNFVKKQSFPQLVVLDFSSLVNAGPILKQILQGGFYSLRHLDISSPLFQQNLEMPQLQNKAYFPKLQELILGSPNFDYTSMKKFITGITTFAPRIQKLQFIEFYPQVYMSILQGDFINSSHSFVIKLGSQQFIINPKEKPHLLTGSIEFLVQTKIILLNGGELPPNINYIKEIINEFNFTKLITLIDSSKVGFIKDYNSRNPNCSFPSLSSLSFSVDEIGDLSILSKCKYMLLQSLSLHIKFDGRTKYFPFLSQQLFPDLNSLSITSSDPEPDLIIQNIQELKYYRLTQLKLSGLNLEAQHLRTLSKWKYFHRITSLDLSSNFIFEDQELWNFEGMVITSLELSQNVIGDKFDLLCPLNVEFLEDLNVTYSGITNEGFMNYMNCKLKSTDIVFPKLDILELNSNYIFSQGIQMLFDGNLPRIRIIQLVQIYSSDLFNIVFGSNCSKRLQFFLTQFNYMETIDENIDKKNTRRLVQLALGSQSLRDQDYQSLGKLQFLSLEELQLLVSHVEECQTLQAILKIAARSLLIALSFQESYSLNSSCFNESKIDTKNIIPQIFALQVETPSLFLRLFVNSFLNRGQHLQNISIPFTYVSCDKISLIAKHAYISELSEVNLAGNNLTDICIKDLLSHDFKKLNTLNLEQNPLLTSEALVGMQNHTYQYLQAISFKDTSIGDKGIQYLVRNKFYSLVDLRLGDMGITGKGLETLSSLHAPFLETLDISCNRLTVEEIKRLNVSNLHNLKTIGLYPSMTENDLDQLFIHFNERRSQPLTIETSITYITF